MPNANNAPLAPRQEQAGEQRDEEELGVVGEEAEEVLEEVVVRREAVHRLVQGEIHGHRRVMTSDAGADGFGAAGA